MLGDDFVILANTAVKCVKGFSAACLVRPITPKYLRHIATDATQYRHDVMSINAEIGKLPPQLVNDASEADARALLRGKYRAVIIIKVYSRHDEYSGDNHIVC